MSLSTTLSRFSREMLIYMKKKEDFVEESWNAVNRKGLEVKFLD